MLCRTRSRAHSLELHFLQNRVDPTQSMGWSWPLAGLWEAQVKQSINCLLSPCECLLLWINPMHFFSRQSSQSQMISWQWQRIKAVSKLLGNSNTSKKYRKLKIHDLLYFNGDNHTKKNKQTKNMQAHWSRKTWLAEVHQDCIPAHHDLSEEVPDVHWQTAPPHLQPLLPQVGNLSNDMLDTDYWHWLKMNYF